MSGPLGIASGPGAMKAAQFVVVGAVPASLPQGRQLTGTASRIVVTDGGAGLPVTLSPGALIVQTDQANTWTTGVQTINTGAIGNQALILKMHAGQTENGFEFLSSGNVVKTKIEPDGSVQIANSLSVGAATDARWRIRCEHTIATAGEVAELRFLGTFNTNAQIGRGIYGEARTNGAADINTLEGLHNVVRIAGASAITVTRMRAMRAVLRVDNTNAGSTSVDNYLFYGDTEGAGVTALTTLYGLYLDDMTRAATNYAIYTNAGDVRFGDSVLIDNLTTTKVGLTIQLAAAQTANLTEWQDSAGNVLSGADERGILFSDGGTDVDNVLLGANAGNIGVMSGDNNIWIGADTGASATTLNNSVLIGTRAGTTYTSGAFNFCLGTFAGRLAIVGSSNVYIGYSAGYNSTYGDHNVCIGNNSGLGITGNADHHTCIGSETGVHLGLNSAGSVMLGYSAGHDETNSNRLYIANSNTATPLIYGEFPNTTLILGAPVTIGIGGAGVDYTLTFDGETNDGVLTWMEDEARFDFVDDVAIAVDSKGLFLGGAQDMDIGYDGTDGYLRTDLVAASDFNLDCGANKTLELQTTVWKDINIGSAMLSKPAASQPDEEQFTDEAGDVTGIYTLGFAIGEKVSGNFEIQHDYAEGTDFVFHAHWQGIAAPSGTDNVQWRITYAFMRDDTTLDVPTTTDSADTPIDTQYESYKSNIVTIDGATAGNNGSGVLIGDQFIFTLERVAATGDIYLGDALVASVGMHYEVNTMGSRQIGTK